MVENEAVKSNRVAVPLEEAVEVDGRDDVKVGTAIGKARDEEANGAFRLSIIMLNTDSYSCSLLQNIDSCSRSFLSGRCMSLSSIIFLRHVVRESITFQWPLRYSVSSAIVC